MRKNSPPGLPKTLSRLRKGAGLTQQNIADYLGIERSTFSYYETGKTTPDVHTLYRLSQLFKVPMEHFFVPEIPGKAPFKKL